MKYQDETGYIGDDINITADIKMYADQIANATTAEEKQDIWKTIAIIADNMSRAVIVKRS